MYVAPAAVIVLVGLGFLLKGLLGSSGKDPGPIAGGVNKDKIEIQYEILDEVDERSTGLASFKIEDQPEERDPKVKPPAVKVEVKEGPGEDKGKPGAAFPVDPTARVRFQIGPTLGRFGVFTTGEGGIMGRKNLTFGIDGSTNNTVVKVDGIAGPLQEGFGRWTLSPRIGEQESSVGTWEFGGALGKKAKGGVVVEQLLEVVPSKQPVMVGGKQMLLRDTVLVRYVIHNKDTRAHSAGIRLQIDTLIGGNDGVPFTVPGRPGLVNTIADFPRPELVPDFVQALETGDLANPGTIGHMTLKAGGTIEPPDRVSLTHWPGSGNNNWELPLRNLTGDSAIVLYFNEKPIPPGGKREVGFAYGLGAVSAEKAGKLGLTLGGSIEPGSTFTITALVQNPLPGQTVTLELPDGLERQEGELLQKVPPAVGGLTSVITWKAKVLRTGEFRVKVTSSNGLSQTTTISISRAQADQLVLNLIGPFERHRDFTVSAEVTDPVKDQMLTLILPPALERSEGKEKQPVPAPLPGEKTSRVHWKVKIKEMGKLPVKVSSSTGVTASKTLTLEEAVQTGSFRLTLDGDFQPGKTFSVKALVHDPAPGQKLYLILPAGLSRTKGEEFAPLIPAGGKAEALWQVRIEKPGKYTLAVHSSTGVIQKKTLSISDPEEPGRFNFDLLGTIAPEKEVTIKAKVTRPVPGQKLTLELPAGMKLLSGDASQPVSDVAEVSWQVRILEAGRWPIRIASSTGSSRTRTLLLTVTKVAP